MPCRSKITKEHLERLSVLVKRKAAIEEKILIHAIKLEKAYLNANQELSVVVVGRQRDLEALSKPPVCQPQEICKSS